MIENNVKSFLENNTDYGKKELINSLMNVFDYNSELALAVYKIWRKQYKLEDYKTEESKYTKEEIKLLRKLDEEYLKGEKSKNWW